MRDNDRSEAVWDPEAPQDEADDGSISDFSRRNVITTVGLGTLFSVTDPLDHQMTQNRSTISGRVTDIEENPVPDAGIHIYKLTLFSDRTPSSSPTRITNTTTGSNGEWEISLDLDQIELTNPEDRSTPDLAEIVLVARKSDWFDAKNCGLQEFVTTDHQQTLRREFILEEAHTQGPPTEEIIRLGGDEESYYGTVSVWRTFPRDTSIQRIHTMLHTATSIADNNTDLIQRSARLKQAVLAVQVPEDISLSNPSDNITSVQMPLNAGVIPHTEDVGRNSNDELFNVHTDVGVPGPLSPAVGHSYLGDLYRPPEETDPSAVDEILGAFFFLYAGSIPYAGSIIGLMSALGKITSAVTNGSDDGPSFDNTETGYGDKRDIKPPDPNTYDSVAFGHDRAPVLGSFPSPLQDDSFESMTFVTEIDWEASGQDQTNLTVRAVWRRNKRFLTIDPGPESSEFAFGTTLNRHPPLPGAKRTQPDTDMEAPSINATVKSDQFPDGSYAAPVTVSLLASDPDGRVKSIKYRIDDGPVQQASSSSTAVTLTQEGTHTVEFRAVDDDGIESELKQKVVTVSPDQVQLNLTASETKPAEGEPVRFSVTRASDDNEIAESTISVAGETLETSAAGSAQYTFSEPGTYTVTASKDRTSNSRYISDSIEIKVVGAAGNTELAGVWATFQGDYSRAGYRPRGTAPSENVTEVWSQFAQARETSPVVADGVVYASRGSDLAAFDADNGDVDWKYPFDGNLGAAPIVVDNKRTDETDVYIVTTEGVLHGINAGNGERRWKKPLSAPGQSSGEIRNEFAIVNNIAYVPVDDPQPDAQDGTNLDALVAVNLRTQNVLWTYEAEHIGGVADADERLYVAAGEDEMLLKFHAGERQAKYWSYKTPTENGLARGEKVLGTPSIRDGTVYIRDREFQVHAVDADGGDPDGTPVWKSSPLPRENPNAPDSPASMAVTDDRIIVSNESNRLFALDKSTGSREKNFSVEGAHFRSPVVVGKTVYATTESGDLYAIDANSGTEQWRYETNDIGIPEGSPAVADGVIYFQGGDIKLHALKDV